MLCHGVTEATTVGWADFVITNILYFVIDFVITNILLIPIEQIFSLKHYNFLVLQHIQKIVIIAIMINIETKNGQLFSKTCFGMLMPSSVQ